MDQEEPEAQSGVASVTKILRYLDSSLLLVSTASGNLSIIDFDDIESTFNKVEKIHEGSITSMCFCDNSKLLVTSSANIDPVSGGDTETEESGTGTVGVVKVHRPVVLNN